MAGVNRVGETVIANNGMEMEIIRYKNSDDISVRFKDGYVVEHTTYGTFISRNIRNPNVAYYPSTQRLLNLQATRLGQQIRASNGMMMKIIAYRKTGDIDVQFEDGLIREHTYLRSFLRGEISHDAGYTLNNVMFQKFAYEYAGIRNFYCRCKKCGKEDIMSIQEVKDHIC